MNGSSDDISIIVFALLAVFVLWKLRSVLGTRVGNEPPPYDPFRRPGQPPEPGNPKANDDGRVVRLPGSRAVSAPGALPAPVDRWDSYARRGSRSWSGLDAIAAADPSFDASAFLRGAASAYEMIVLGFAGKDRETLRGLLSEDVFASFDKAIRDLEEKGETKETIIVSVGPGILEDAQMKDDVAQIAVRFDAKLISVTRGRDGAVVEGSPDKVEEHLDVWTFARPVHSPDPNWKLVATQSAEI